jgi:hypothetical protein
MALYHDIIFRPGGTAANNVYTTWATALAAAQAEGSARILVDSSLAAAQVPSGTHALGGAISLGPFAWGTVGLTNPNATLTILDGGILKDLQGIDGPLIVQCTCTTSKALDFTWGPGETLFRMSFGAEIQMLSGATVAACQIPQPSTGILGELDILSIMDPVLDASATPGVPIFDLMSTNASFTSCLGFAGYSGLTINGDVVRGGSGTKSQVLWDTDDTIGGFSSSLFAGTLTTVHISSSGVTKYTPGVPGNWANTAPTTVKQALDRIAANTTNAHPIP